MIDGQNIGDIGLHDLRSKITILPQVCTVTTCFEIVYFFFSF